MQSKNTLQRKRQCFQRSRQQLPLLTITEINSHSGLLDVSVFVTHQCHSVYLDPDLSLLQKPFQNSWFSTICWMDLTHSHFCLVNCKILKETKRELFQNKGDKSKCTAYLEDNSFSKEMQIRMLSDIKETHCPGYSQGNQNKAMQRTLCCTIQQTI